MDPKLSKLLERIRELAKEVVAEEKSKEEKRSVKQLTKELINLIKEYWEVREFIAEIIKLVNIIEETHEKLEKTYLKLTEELTEENEKIREIAEILEEILENLERDVLDEYRLIISDRKYVLVTDGDGYFLGIDSEGRFVFWTEGYSPNKYFQVTENLSKQELRYLLATLEPA